MFHPLATGDNTMTSKIITPRKNIIGGGLAPPVKPRTTKVTMTIGRTVNLGNYESLRMEISAESGVGDSQALDVLDVLEKSILKDLNERIEKNIKALRS